MTDPAVKAQLIEKIYGDIRLDLSEKDRREAARIMAEEILQIERDARADHALHGAERARQNQEWDRLEKVFAERECAELRSSLAYLEGLARNGPPRGERMTPEELAAVPGKIADRQQLLAKRCP